MPHTEPQTAHKSTMKLCLMLLVLLWKNVDSSLTQKECSKLPTSEHAFVSEEFRKAEYQEGDVIFFSCAPGYTTHLNTTYICTDMGWRAVTIGQCSEHTGPVALSCRQPPPLENGYSQPYSLQYESGQRVRYWCNESYTMRGGPNRTCTNGQWTEDIQCISIFCEKPLIDNGVVLGDKQKFKENEFLRYSCHPGYKKVDGRPSVCQLGLTAQWIPRPECELLTCKLKYNKWFSDTKYDPNQLVYRPGQTVNVSCGEKDWVKSKELRSAQIECQDTGLWDFLSGCQLVTCFKQAEHVVQWERSWNPIKIGDTLWYWCENGYDKTTDSRAECTRRGWQPDPLCKARGCARPSNRDAVITDSRLKERYGHDDTVHFQCSHDPDTSFTVTCQFGRWTEGQRCEAGQ